MLYLPDFPADLTLSRWAGRPSGLTIDPLGVEAYVMETPKRSLFGRPKPAAASGYLHVLVHQELPSERIRAWCATQVAQVGVLEQHPDAYGDELNRLTADEADRLADLAWTPTHLVIDGQPVDGVAYVAEPERWAAYAEVGPDRIAIIARGLRRDAAPLRSASDDEANRWRAEALRV